MNAFPLKRWRLLSLALAIAAMALAVRADEPLEIRRLYVPREKLPEFVPKDQVTLRLSEAEFGQLLERRRFSASLGARPATQARLTARFDENKTRLIGVGRWTIPGGRGTVARLAPWNLLVRSVRDERGERRFGMTALDELLIELADGATSELIVEWEALPHSHADRLQFDVKTPATALATLALTIPPRWTVRSASRLAAAADAEPGKGPVEVFFGGATGFMLDLRRPGSRLAGSGSLAAQADYVYRLDETGTELTGEIRLEALEFPIDEISLKMDAQLAPQELKASVPARWRRDTPGDDGLARWRAELRRPAQGPLRVDLRALLPAAVGTEWRPPTILVEDALPRGEQMTLSLAKQLRLTSLLPGRYERTYAGRDPEGRYQLVYRASGEQAVSDATAALVESDVLDWTGFAEAVLVDAAVEGPTPAKKLLALTSPTFSDRLKAIRAGKAPSKRDEGLLLEEVNKALARPEFFDAASFARIGGEALLRGDGTSPTEPSAAANLARNRRLLQAAYPGEIARGRRTRGAPTLRVVAGEADVAVSQQVFLDLRRDRVRLAGQIGWTVQSGALYQPTAWTPPGWTVTHVEAEPANRLLQYRTEPLDDGGAVVALQLDRALAAGESLRAMVFAEPQLAPTLQVREPTEFPLPEIRPHDSPASDGATYTVFLDPGLPCGKEALPAARGAATTYPWPRRPACEEYVFPFAPPLQNVSLMLLAEQARYVVDSSQRIRWENGGWRVEWDIDVSVEQGVVRSIPLEATTRLPPGITWRADGDVAAAIAEGDKGKDGGTRITLAAPIDRRARLSATWTSAEPTFAPLLVAFPGSDRFQSSIAVRGPAGAPMEVESVGLVDADPSGGRESVASTGLVWETRFSRLPEGASLRLRAPTVSHAPAEESSSRGNSHDWASVRVRSLIEPKRTIHRVSAELEARRSRELEIRLPPHARLWSISLDRESIGERLVRGDSLRLEEIPPGQHLLEIAYEEPASTWLTFRRVEAPSPLMGWSLASTIWEIEHEGRAFAMGARGLRRARELLAAPIDGSLAPPPSALADRAQALSEVQPIFASSAAAKDDVAAVLVELQAGLGDARTIVVDSRAVAGIDSSIAERLRGATRFADWLAALRLDAQVEGDAVIIGRGRILAGHRPGSVSDEPSAWAAALSEDIRRQGQDRLGRFVSPATLLARGSARDSLGDIEPSSFLATHSFDFDIVDPAATAAIIIPVEDVNRWGRVAALFAGASIVSLGRRIGWRLCQRLMLGAFIGVVACNLAGGVVKSLFGPVCWTVALAAGLLLLLRIVRRKTGASPAMGSTASLALTSLVVAMAPARAKAQSAEPPVSPGPYRVVIPFDPSAPDDLSRPVIAPRELILQLQQLDAKPPAIWVRRMELDGEASANDEVRWRATIEIAGPFNRREATPVALGFDAVRLTAVRVGGDVVPFRPPGRNTGVEITLPAGDAKRIELEFSTPVLGGPVRREVDFVIPRAAENRARLILASDVSLLTSESSPAGFSLESKDRATVVGEFGPADRVRIRWRPATPPGPPVRPAVTAGWILDVGAEGHDLYGAMRFDAIDPIDKLNLDVDPNLVIRRVDAPGLARWELGTEAAGRGKDRRLNLVFEPPLQGSGLVRIQAIVRVENPSHVRLPTLAPRDAATESGVVAVRLPEGWTIQGQDFRNAEPETAENFLAAWKRLEQPPVEQLTVIKRYRQRPLALSLAIERDPSRFSIQQRFQVTANPLSRFVEIDGTFTAQPVRGDLTGFRVRLPKDLEVLRVEGADVDHWFVDGSTLLIMLNRPIRGRWEGKWRARARGAAGVGVGRDPVAFPLAGLEWQGAGQSECVWRVNPLVGWKLAIEKKSGVAVTDADGGGVTVVGSPSHSFQLSLAPATPELDVRATTLVTLGRELATFEGRFEAFIAQGTPNRLEFIAPAFDESIAWAAPDWRLRGSSVRGAERAWLFEPIRPLSGRFNVEWRLTRKISPGDSFDAPRVRLAGISPREEYLVVHDRGESSLVVGEPRGLAPMEVGVEPVPWPAGASVAPASPQLAAYRAEANDWRLPLRARTTPIPAEGFVVRNAELDVLRNAGGAWRIALRWEILDRAANVLSLKVPPGVAIEEIRVDGVSNVPPDPVDGTIRFPLFRKGTWQEIAVFASSLDSAEGEIRLPSLDSTTEFPTLARLRSSADRRGRVAAIRIDRSSWLARRLELSLDRLADVLKEAEGNESNSSDDKLLSLLGQVRVIEAQLAESSARGSEATRRRAAELGQRKIEMLRRHQAEGFAKRGASEHAELDGSVSIGDAIAENVEYFQSEQPIQEVSFRPRLRVWMPRLPTDRLVSLATALFALGFLLTPYLWRPFRLYWPAGLFALSIAWLRFGEASFLGVLFLALAVAGFAHYAKSWSNLPGPDPTIQGQSP